MILIKMQTETKYKNILYFSVAWIFKICLYLHGHKTVVYK